MQTDEHFEFQTSLWRAGGGGLGQHAQVSGMGGMTIWRASKDGGERRGGAVPEFPKDKRAMICNDGVSDLIQPPTLTDSR